MFSLSFQQCNPDTLLNDAAQIIFDILAGFFAELAMTIADRKEMEFLVHFEICYCKKLVLIKFKKSRF
jgi:hypothetical protein